MTTAVQLAQSAAPGVSLGFKNRIINGGMTIDQRYAGAATANTINGYVVDRWNVQQTTTGKLIAQQNQGSVTPPAGFTNYLGVTSQSAYSVLTGDQYVIQQTIEGYNVADLQWGTATALPVTLSAWVRSSLTGTFSGYLLLYNGSTFQSYAFTYSIPVANTWTYITATIPGNTSFVGSTSNSYGMWVRFNLGAGSTYNETAGSWQAGNTGFVSGSQSVVGTNGATFYITGVQLEVGTAATSFEFRDYGRELALCQRYFVLLGTLTGGYTLTLGSGLSNGGQSGWRTSIKVPQVLRATPSLTTVNLTGWNPNISPQTLTSLGTVYALNGMCVEADLNYGGAVGTGGMVVNLQTNGSGGASYLGVSAEL